MSYIIVSVVSFAFGCLATFLIYGNNQEKMNAAYAKSVDALDKSHKAIDALQKEVADLRSKYGAKP